MQRVKVKPGTALVNIKVRYADHWVELKNVVLPERSAQAIFNSCLPSPLAAKYPKSAAKE